MIANNNIRIRCVGVLDLDGSEVQRVFDSAFQELGLPAAIRSDKASSVGRRLTKLSVWPIRLGIRVERITPGKPTFDGEIDRERSDGGAREDAHAIAMP